MRALTRTFAALALSTFAACSSAPRPARWDNPWAKIALPSPAADPRPIGSYSLGCIDGARPLPLDGAGYQVMRPSRNRFYGHPDLLRFITALGADVSRRGMGPLLIGDLGQPRGGPMPNAHASHQIGLDVDVWFDLRPEARLRKLTSEERETFAAGAVADLRSVSLLPGRWMPEHAAILKLAADRPEVERIFVNAAIKRELCRVADSGAVPAGDRAWLRKLRPWYQHHDHFHVRLRCPEGAADCARQAAAPEGDGCGADLEWWFSDEARKPPAPSKVDAGEAPEMPAACAAVLGP